MTTVVSCNPAVMSGGSNSVKARQQAMWASGDFAVIGTTLQIVGELLNEAADVQADRSRPRCGRRQWQCDAGRGAALCQRDIYRLRARAARGRTSAR